MVDVYAQATKGAAVPMLGCVRWEFCMRREAALHGRTLVEAVAHRAFLSRLSCPLIVYGTSLAKVDSDRNPI